MRERSFEFVGFGVLFAVIIQLIKAAFCYIIEGPDKPPETPEVKPPPPKLPPKPQPNPKSLARGAKCPYCGKQVAPSLEICPHCRMRIAHIW